MIDYYYSSGSMYIHCDKMVYKLMVSKDFLRDIFWRENQIWIESFGRVDMGTCTEYKYYELPAETQVRCSGISGFILSEKQNWIMDIEKSFIYYKNTFFKTVKKIYDIYKYK